MMAFSGDGVTDMRGDGGVEFCGDGITESLGNGATESRGDEVMDLGNSVGVMESESE